MGTKVVDVPKLAVCRDELVRILRQFGSEILLVSLSFFHCSS